jgi:hypothetical protein
MNSPDTDLAATVNLFFFPEPHAGAPGNPLAPPNSHSKDVTVCFSGGGSRALSAALGQLRGLHQLGLLDKTRTLSGVSGGAWATIAYTFLPEAISDSDFLGGVCEDPSKLTVDEHSSESAACELDSLTPNNLGRVPGRLNLLNASAQALEWHSQGVPDHEIWVRLVGKNIFQDYQRYTSYGQSNYFTWSEDWFSQKIAPHNPQLKCDDFYLLPSDRYRPALFIHGSLIPREGEHDDELLPFMFSPGGSGVLSSFPAGPGQQLAIGGGAIDSFGLASAGQSSIGPGLQQVELAADKFSLADMAGISSSFFAETLSSMHPELDSLIPRYRYWPVTEADDTPGHVYGFADGGDLENTGIASMLRFAPANLIAFVNSANPLRLDERYSCAIIDSQVPPLFGYQPYTRDATWTGQDWAYKLYPQEGDPEALLQADYAIFRHNQVFPSSAFKDFLAQLWGAQQRGGTVLCKQENLATVANDKYGVQAGHVNILWAYNNPVDEWRRQLHWAVDAAIDVDPLTSSFPCYPTAEIELSARQVNLLAHLSCWNIISENAHSNTQGLSNRQMFESMYSEQVS